MGNDIFSVLRNATGDYTGNGLSNRVNKALTFFYCTRDEAIQYCKDNLINPEKCFYIVKRTLWREDHSYAEPLIKQTGLQMFGGNFLYTSNDSSFKFKGEKCTRPIAIHDRYE